MKLLTTLQEHLQLNWTYEKIQQISSNNLTITEANVNQNLIVQP